MKKPGNIGKHCQQKLAKQVSQSTAIWRTNVQLLVKFTVLWCTVKDMERLGKNPPDNFGTVWRNTEKIMQISELIEGFEFLHM